MNRAGRFPLISFQLTGDIDRMTNKEQTLEYWMEKTNALSVQNKALHDQNRELRALLIESERERKNLRRIVQHDIHEEIESLISECGLDG